MAEPFVDPVHQSVDSVDPGWSELIRAVRTSAVRTRSAPSARHRLHSVVRETDDGVPVLHWDQLDVPIAAPTGGAIRDRIPGQRQPIEDTHASVTGPAQRPGEAPATRFHPPRMR